MEDFKIYEIAEKIGKSDALEYLYYDALLINQTEKGFGFVPLWAKGISLTLNVDKMEAKYRFVLVLQKKQSLIMKKTLHVLYKNLIRNKIMKAPVRFMRSLEFFYFIYKIKYICYL